MTTITAEVVETLAQAQELRRLRNKCRLSMTRDTRRVGRDAQREFFGSQIAPGAVRAFLLRRDAEPVAYSLLRAAEGCWWLSCGVAGAHRSKGYGTVVVRLATTAGLDTGLPVRLEVWADNERAVHVYEKAGYVVASETVREGRALKVMVAR